MRLKGDDFYKQVNGQIGKFKFEVGILEDKPKRLPVYGTINTVKGMQVLKMGKSSKKVTLTQVAEWLDKSPLWLRWLSRPFMSSKNDDVLRVVSDIAKLMNKSTIVDSDKRRLINGIQAIVRNPILRKDYRANRLITQRRKGFNHMMVMTGQFFNAIKARLINV